jgi:hypothetical protein
MEGLLGATGDGIDSKRSGGVTGGYRAELIANGLEGLLGATCDGIGNKRSGGVTGGHRGWN